ncbi:MAG: pyruvate kinase alpha/beta domain-containing protein, partial [Syntrophomonadaceae bacterium]|nr:pyruvate kinase alpha/beta domain-containing protein [Syntrophomonadaceae bacterium]
VRIASRAEEILPYQEILRQKRLQGNLSVTDAISYATCATALSLNASAIITPTVTGYTPKMVAKYRPQAKIIGVTTKPRILNKLALVWGVYPKLIPETSGTDDLFKESAQAALDGGYIDNGDLVVLTAGVPSGFAGGTNLLKVHVVGDILVQGIGIGKEPISGRVKIVIYPEDFPRIESGDIVVTTSADCSLAPYLDKIAALVAEEGGLTSNAAIMGLNANIPVIVGAHKATDILADNMLVTIDTGNGHIYRGLARVR